ncbi:MAG: hypothetical protein MJZ58_03210 [Paludibacteraceae bacterium]|nr:hypothetical protein [Paludibacteraceae bacterium]
MKKIFSFVAAALMSVSMFAYDGAVPTDADLDFEAGKLTIAVHFSKVCGDVYFVGTYNNWAKGDGDTETFDNCQKFKAVEGFDGWYQIQIEDASASIEGKPVHTTPDGAWSWDYQTGDENSWELIRGTVEITAGYAGESNLKGYGTDAPVVLVSNAWKNDPCSIVYGNYHIVVDAPLCGNFAPMLVGGFDGWKGTPMIADEANFNYYLNITTAQGGEYKIVAVPTDGATDIWANELQYYVDSTESWNNFSNQVLPESQDDPINVYLDYSDETHYRWAKCAAPVEYKYTEYVNWQLKHEGSGWEWTENLVKVGEGLFKLADANWTGSGFNVASDENPIKKDWFAPEELVLGEEVIAPVTVDVYLKVVDDETVAIGVGVEPVVALENVKAVKASKAIMKDGQIVFQAGDKVFNVLGAEVK